MRLFIALELPNQIKKVLQDSAQQLHQKFDSSIRLVAPEQLHLTLLFLGDVPDDQLPLIQKALESIVFDQFQACLGQLGVLPSPKHIRVMYVALIGEQLAVLVEQIKSAVASLVVLEARDFLSHITIARVKKSKEKQLLMQAIKEIEVPELCFTVNGFVLKQSELSPDGAKHTVIKEYIF